MRPEITALVERFIASRRALFDRQTEVRRQLHEAETDLIRAALGANETLEDQNAAHMLDMLAQSYRLDIEMAESAVKIAQAVRDAETGAEGS